MFLVPLHYRSKYIYTQKGSDWDSVGKVSHYVGVGCVSFHGGTSNGTPGF